MPTCKWSASQAQEKPDHDKIKLTAHMEKEEKIIVNIEIAICQSALLTYPRGRETFLAPLAV